MCAFRSFFILWFHISKTVIWGAYLITAIADCCDVLHLFFFSASSPISFHAIPGHGLHFYSIRLLWFFSSIESGIEFHTLNVTIHDIKTNEMTMGSGNANPWVKYRQMFGGWIVLILGLKNIHIQSVLNFANIWHFGKEMLWVKVNGRFAFVFSSKFIIHYFCSFLLTTFRVSLLFFCSLLTSFTCF